MTTGQLILILLLVLVAAVLVALILRRGSARREEQRVEAAELRSQAEAVAPAVAGQSAFAEQAEQRADVARAEAEEKAREAARLEEEAAEQRRAAEAARQEHEAILRRADDVDPDVKDSQYPPVPEDARPEPAPSEGARSEVEPATSVADPADDDQPMTRAERRRAREEAEARGEEVPEGAESAESAESGEPGESGESAESGEESRWASGPAAPIAGAAGAAAVGTAAWAADDERSGPDEERSARIASAADYRDDVEGEGGQVRARHEDVSTRTGTGTEQGMDPNQQPATTTTDTPGTADHALADAGRADTDLTADAASPTGEWGGPREGEEARTGAAAPSTDESASAGDGLAMVDDIQAYAATEPVLAEDQAPPVEPERPSASSTSATEQRATAAQAKEGTDAEVVTDIESYAATEPVLADGSTAPARAAEAAPDAGDTPESVTQEHPGRSDADRDDATPEHDWAAEEGELLEENRERGDRLAADREALGEEARADEAPRAEERAATHEEGVPESADQATDQADTAATDAPVATGRRVSEFQEIRDGGFGVGSAAPLEDGAQPMGHPIAAYRDTMTFRGPGDAGYEDTDPDVWFYDEGAAERSGFRRSEG